jgi:hypothetical protein
MAGTVASLPEQGQLVSVRSRRWVVGEVNKSTLPPPPLEPVPAQAQHLISLLSVEDDALGEELQVVWEIEPGADVIEKVALPEPTGFDPPDQLNAFLDAVRWGASSSADVRNIQSPFRSGIDIEDYQLDPVVRAIQMPRVNLLVADDVGGDGRWLFLSSANLTKSAFSLNMELGLLITGGHAPVKIERIFESLISDGMLAAVS